MAKRGQPDIQWRRECSAIERHNDMLEAAELRSGDPGTQRRMAAPADQDIALVKQVPAATAGVMQQPGSGLTFGHELNNSRGQV